MEGNFFRFDAQRSHGDSFVVTQKPNLVSSSPMEVNENGCFDCNICLDTAHDPVVTLCGHLFCWPCIYRWLDVQSSSVSIDHQQNCPVCKANISIVSLVPLYGRGISSSTFKETPAETSIIPQRPSPSALNNFITSASSLNPNSQHQTQSATLHHHPQYYPRHHNGFTTTESNDLANAVMMSFLYPVIGMLGDMVHTRIFGTFTNALTHPYQNSHAIVGNSHRMMQLEKSLNRVSIFFLCCILLCLFLF